jgi:hypothetical protein
MATETEAAIPNAFYKISDGRDLFFAQIPNERLAANINRKIPDDTDKRVFSIKTDPGEMIAMQE